MAVAAQYYVLSTCYKGKKSSGKPMVYCWLEEVVEKKDKCASALNRTHGNDEMFVGNTSGRTQQSFTSVERRRAAVGAEGVSRTAR